LGTVPFEVSPLIWRAQPTPAGHDRKSIRSIRRDCTAGSRRMML